jgi:hypothetical protein
MNANGRDMRGRAGHGDDAAFASETAETALGAAAGGYFQEPCKSLLLVVHRSSFY